MSAVTPPPSSSPSSPFRRWLTLVIVLAVLALVVWRLGPGGGGAGKKGPAAADEPIPVRVQSAARQDYPVNLTAMGTVTAYNTANVRPRVDGLLTAVLFQEGQWVKAGELLAQIDPRPYQASLKQAEGALMQNQAQLRNAQIDLKRYQGLYAKDSIAKQTLDTQEAEVGQYQGTVNSNQADVDSARLNLEFTRVTAPISGRVGLRQVDVGNLVSSGDQTPIAIITQTRPIAVDFTLPENEVPQVLAARAANPKLAVEVWDRDEKARLDSGVLQSVDNQIDLTTGTLRLKARFENPGESLFPNQFVNVHLQVAQLRGALVVASDAVQYGSIGTFVYVIDKDGKAKIRQVKPGPSGNLKTVIEEGLAPGERVVVEGMERLRDGSPVEVLAAEEGPKGSAAPVSGG